MQPLEDGPRRALLSTSALLCASSLLLLPIAARSSRPAFRQPAAAAQEYAALQMQPAARVLVPQLRRDPFAADRGFPTVNSAAPAGNGMSIVGMRVVQGESTGYSLPGSSSGTVLRAVVRGSDGARALVEVGGRTAIVSAGDKLGNSRIVRIDAGGVRLADGTQLRVGSETP
ncbi:MAG TPA: hypothetical protein VFA29_03455 [Candidatus Baltobacteraceae bacterium]|nr:hypothetical protein [Candidatus Baltobacteraceae bacterium]